jgi:hypothetical protein
MFGDTPRTSGVTTLTQGGLYGACIPRFMVRHARRETLSQTRGLPTRV